MTRASGWEVTDRDRLSTVLWLFGEQGRGVAYDRRPSVSVTLDALVLARRALAAETERRERAEGELGRLCARLRAEHDCMLDAATRTPGSSASRTLVRRARELREDLAPEAFKK